LLVRRGTSAMLTPAALARAGIGGNWPPSAPKMPHTGFLHTKRIYRRWNNRGNLFPAKFPLQKSIFPSNRKSSAERFSEPPVISAAARGALWRPRAGRPGAMAPRAVAAPLDRSRLMGLSGSHRGERAREVAKSPGPDPDTHCYGQRDRGADFSGAGGRPAAARGRDVCRALWRAGSVRPTATKRRSRVRGAPPRPRCQKTRSERLLSLDT
jgi:hypothetical protein